MTAGFGGSGYTTPQTRALNSIANGGQPDTSSQEKMVELLQKHSAQLKYLAANQKQMQQGINEATANPVQQLQQFVADIIVLLGGGELAKGALDFGDLQYILPALGALFGFGDGPFPISLFEAASRFFFGYVVPQEQFVDVINSIITAWAGVFGIDPEFVADVRALVAAVGNLFDGLGNLLPSLEQLFDALGISGADLGPLGQALAPIIQLFAGIDLTQFGNFIEFITDAISPFIEQLTALINFINGMLAVLGYDGGDVVNSPIELLLQPFRNLISFLADLNLFDPGFDPVAAVSQFVNAMLLPLNMLLGPNSPLNPANILGRLRINQIGGVPLANVITQTSNLFAEFISAASVPNVDGWSFDAANNAAQVVLDGTTKAIYDDPVDVAPGQELDASIQALLASVASTPGSAVQLALLTYDGISETPAGTVVLASIANPSGSATWATLSGTYTVPASGVKAVAPTLKVVGGTSGTVKFKTPAGELVLPDSLQGGLRRIFDELRDIFDGAQEQAPVNPVADVIKNWWDIFFNGGSRQVVTHEQIAEPTGVPPTDANNTVPWEYLPPELTPAAIGHPWVELTKVGAQTINRTAATKVNGWTQAGGFPLAEPISSEFRVPFDGLFHIKAKAAWATSPDTYGRLRLDINGSTYRQDYRITDGMSNIAYNEIDEFVPLSAGDTFAFYAQWDGTGTTREVSASPLSYVRITYIGATHLTATPIPTPTVTFDAKGTADNGSGDAGWNHTFGPNAKTIVIPFSHEAPEMPTISCGPYNVPVLSGPTFIGNYFGFNARYSLAATILPDAVKGTTQPITVDFPSGNAAFSGNSLSFNNVAYLGAVRASSGNGGGGDPARMLVPSNAFSQVAGGFGGMDANFSGFNRTQDNIWNFIAGNTWAHVMGHAQGGLEFMASGGWWAGKFIELHP